MSMDFLPIVLKKGQLFLEALSNNGCRQRFLSPSGRLVSFLDPAGRLKVHLLLSPGGDEEPVAVDASRQFVSCQWIPPNASSQEVVIDADQHYQNEFIAVSSTFDLFWFAVNEVSKGKRQAEEEQEHVPEGIGVSVECLAALRRSDLSDELRNLEHADTVNAITVLGSHEGNVLLLIDSILVCTFSLDREFGRLVLLSCLSVRPPHSLGALYQDDTLPGRAGKVIGVCLQSPILLTLCDSGMVFVYSVESGGCIGTISTTEYCRVVSGRQPESEELLSSLSTTQFCHIAISPDLRHLLVSTQDNLLLLVSLPDYFQLFPNHYHPSFASPPTIRRKESTRTSSRKINTSKEEGEERVKYGGLSDRAVAAGDRFVGPYNGSFMWGSRLTQLERRVDRFQPDSRQHLNFYQSSKLSAGATALSSRQDLVGPRDSRPRHRETSEETAEDMRRPWYEKAVSHSSAGTAPLGDFDLHFVTSLKKSVPIVQALDGSDSTGSQESPTTLRHAYRNHCLLPSAASVIDPNSSIVGVGFHSSMVVAYYGSSGGSVPYLEGAEVSPFGVDNTSRWPVTGVAVYRTDLQSFTTTRLPHHSWLLPSSSPDLPVCLANRHYLAVATFNLSQEEFVSKVLMYSSASVAEEVCHLNRWDKCSLPINALETALELRQLDTVAFFLRSRDTDSGEVTQTPDQGGPSTYPDLPTLPALPPDQLDAAVQLLINAIRKNYEEEHTCQFASQLLIMTLGFLTRMIKTQALMEECSSSSSDESPLEAVTEEPSVVASTGLLSPPASPQKRRRTVSGASADTVSIGGLSTAKEQAVSLVDLTSYIHTLRGFLPHTVGPQEGRKQATEVTADGGERREEDYAQLYLDKTLTRTWDKMEPKEVVKDALLRGSFPMAQAYLIQRKPRVTRGSRKGARSYGGFQETSSKPAQTLAEALDDYGPSPGLIEHQLFDPSLSHLLTIGTGFVMEALEKQGVKLATTLLTQMGMDIRSSLRYICFNSLNRQLRDFLAKELTVRKWMNESECQALEYLHILEIYYPLQSYDHALMVHSKQHSRKMLFQSTVLPVVPGIVARPTPIPTVGNLQELYPETFGGDYSLKWDTPAVPSPPMLLPSSPGGALYLQVPLSAVLKWDSATRQRMLFEGFVLTGQTEGVECERLVSKEHVFSYHVSHNDLKNALQFLTSRVPHLEDSTPCPSHILSLCSSMPHTTSYLHHSLLDELARNGVFLPSELSNLPDLLCRMGRINSLFTPPHPLTKVTADHMTFGSGVEGKGEGEVKKGALISLDQFHCSFLKYLISNRFVSLMFHYLDCYGLALDPASISSLHLDTTTCPWVDTMLQYRIAARNPMDQDKVFQASLSCGRLLLCSDSAPHRLTVMDMLQHTRTLMALGTLMFAPAPLEEAMDSSNSRQDWYIDRSALKQAVAAYPTLQAAVFPPPPTTLTPSQSQDISVYHLLQGSVPFNISRLFKWQPTNTLATQDETVEGPHEIPHFSSPKLAEKHSLTEHLTYRYYLHRGQPSFAFANFVAAKLIGHSNTAKRIDHAVSRVYCLAFRDFTNSKVTSSCAAFIEMVDRDSTLLRVDVQAALRITKYSSSQSSASTTSVGGDKHGEPTHRHRKIAGQFIQLHGNPDNHALASSLLSLLETATHNLISSVNTDRCGLEAEECWSLVQSFTHCHHLPRSLAFLTDCAGKGQWLPLLCHAQLHSIPPQKVLMVVDKHFSDPCIQEHLKLAISSMVSAGDDVFSPTSPSVSSHGLPERPRSKRRRANSTRTRSRRAESLVQSQADYRAKFYSKVGLQKDSLPRDQPSPLREPVTRVPSAPTLGGGEGRPREGEEATIRVEVQPTSVSEHPSEVEVAVAIEEEDLPSDLFSVLFKCNAHSSPWRSLLAHAIALQRPLLAILAGCHEEAAMVDCMCVWLYSTLGCSVLEKASLLLGVGGGVSSRGALRYFADLQWRRWTVHDLAIIIVSAMQLCPSPAAHFSLMFQYFDQNNPLLPFLRFHEEFVLRSNYEECRAHLKEFELSLNRCSAMRGYTGSVGDMPWMEQLSTTISSHMLVKCPTPFERSHLLKMLAEAKFGGKFKCNVLDFNHLHQLSSLLNKAGLASDNAFTIRESFSTSPGNKALAEVYSVRVNVYSEHVLGLLLERGQFDVARRYASIVRSTVSEVTIKEAEHNLKKLSRSTYWQYEQARVDFWHHCNSSFEGPDRVDPESAAEFFESIVNSYTTTEEPLRTQQPPHGDEAPPIRCTATERALLLALALKWRKEGGAVTAEQLREFKKEIWLSHIHATIDKMEDLGQVGGSSSLPFLPPSDQQATHSILDTSTLLSSLSISAAEEFKGRRNLGELLLPDSVSIGQETKGRRNLSAKESEAFDMMLGRLLNAGFVSQARELAALFEHDSPDLTIVMCCTHLAQGKLTPDQLTEEVLSLISTRSPRQPTSPTSLSMEDLGGWGRGGGEGRPSVELLRLMHKFSDRASYAQQCCDCIITCFKIAVSLKVAYASVLTLDPFDILTQLLSSKLPDKYSLAKQFVTAGNLESREVGGFLSECVAASLDVHYRADARDSPKSRVYSQEMSSNHFMELIQLCPDNTMLGTSLLTMAKSVSSAETESIEDLQIQVELLIRAHDCYTLGCCVDGIAEVLVVARQWTNTLIRGKRYKLMVRLLTGIGRFHEMSYIIAQLLENDEFESLLHKGVEKEEQLRTALMNYLQRYLPGDHEKMEMVALKFEMFRELAETKENQARRDLRRIKPKHLAASNPDTVKTLKSVFDNFRTAAKTYAQEDCLANAEYCFSQARLVALQLSVLQSGKQVVNLEVKRVHKYMEEQPFSEALIVADAYKKRIWMDWVNPLYKKVVVGGDFKYLQDYKCAFPLTHTIFQELASKYLRDRGRPSDATSNMRKLLAQLKNLPLKRKLAMDMGLVDVLHSLPPDFDDGFLSDIARL